MIKCHKCADSGYLPDPYGDVGPLEPCDCQAGQQAALRNQQSFEQCLRRGPFYNCLCIKPKGHDGAHEDRSGSLWYEVGPLERCDWIESRLGQIGIDVRQSGQHQAMRTYLELLRFEVKATESFLKEDKGNEKGKAYE